MPLRLIGLVMTGRSHVGELVCHAALRSYLIALENVDSSAFVRDATSGFKARQKVVQGLKACV